jgi:hypothetical protein
MSDLQKQVKELRNTIFNMLNFTNMYILVLDEKMEIKFANNSLAIDLGLNKYQRLLGRCWLDFIKEEDITMVKNVHKYISHGIKGWEKYKEFQNTIKGKDRDIFVNWFNSHINSDYSWTFSFGISKKTVYIPITEEDSIDNIRNYYHNMINKDRVMINSMRDVIGLKDKIIDSCKPNFLDNKYEGSLSSCKNEGSLSSLSSISISSSKKNEESIFCGE